MSDIEFPSGGGTLSGHLARPDGAGPWPGVVVLHEIFGLTDDIRLQADRFADAGYLALAPDLYAWGNTARCLISTVRTMMTGTGRALDDIDNARSYLAADPDCTGEVGVIGFCLGGGLAILAAPRGFAVAAPNYGQVPRDAARRLESACPVVASYGGRDHQLKGAAAKLSAALEEAGVPHDVKEYPQAKHGFLFPHHGKAGWAEPLLVQFDPAAADDAWARIFAFFGDHLAVPHEVKGQ